MMNAGWLVSIWSEIFLQMKFIIFQGCPIKQGVFLHGQPAPYNQLLIQSLLLVPKCYFALNVEARVLKFSTHFSQNAVFIGCNILSVVLVISLSWHFHLTNSYLTLVTWHFGSQMVFPNFKRPPSDWFGPKYKSKVSS